MKKQLINYFFRSPFDKPLVSSMGVKSYKKKKKNDIAL